MAERPVDVNLVDVSAGRVAMFRKHSWWPPEMFDDLVLRHSVVQPDQRVAVSA